MIGWIAEVRRGATFPDTGPRCAKRSIIEEPKYKIALAEDRYRSKI